ncbi:zinc resistance-associated protein [Methylorubrum rhodinum]|uniref:Zinc resistance-associated protein n=1 Tax=Methylorubrum rhodinum TaxID=29428 RepID=A0A840ZN08_9HYPH|nr:Spy/CpxP family protein refolding chaperone [Methylorubrum rhodinum]MBB5759429.1 zinc resistance-associated protein [Methylorubrum rhodinum]
MLNRRMMGAAALGLIGIGSVALVAQANERPDPFARGHMHGRWNALSPEDRAAFTDARIAALRTGLKLTPDQEKLWPPVEAAIRDLAKQRDAQRAARRERGRMVDDAPGALRGMADAASARGEALRKLADATTPLFATLDDGQKRRAMVLARPLRPGGEGRGWRHRHGPDRE